MQPEDALPTIAEIAVTLAGFTAVLLAVQSPSSASDAPGQADRLFATLVGPAIVLVCALLPFGLAGLSARLAVVWGIPLCVYGLASALLASRTIARIARGSAQLTWPLIGYSILTATAISSLLALGSGLGFFMPFSSGVLVLVLIWNLLTAAFSLITAVRGALRAHAA